MKVTYFRHKRDIEYYGTVILGFHYLKYKDNQSKRYPKRFGHYNLDIYITLFNVEFSLWIRYSKFFFNITIEQEKLIKENEENFKDLVNCLKKGNISENNT